MPTANEQILDRTISHQVDFQGYSNNVTRRMIALLNRVDADLSGRIREAAERGAGNIERLEILLSSVRSLNMEAYQSVDRELTQELRDLTAEEIDWQDATFKQAVGQAAAAQISFAAVSPQQVHAAAMARPFQGRLLREWMDSLEADRARRVRDTIRQGFISGETPDQITRTLRGTRAAGYADGLLETDRRHLRSVVNTALGHTANFARDRYLQANSDIIKGIKWVSTLDSKTTLEFCVPRDGLLYTVDHQPIGHNFSWGAGPGAIHWNCRSSSVPVLESAEELGLTDIPPETRASIDGQVPADTSFGDWLKRQSRGRVEDVLGKERADIYFAQGKTIDRFYNRAGRLKTLEQLRQSE